MIRRVRVILSANAQQFERGMRRATRSFRNFQSTIAGFAGGAAFFGLTKTFDLLVGAIRRAGGALKDLGNTMIGGAIAQQRFEIILGNIVDDAGRADEIIGALDERIKHYGVDADQARQATIQMALALRGMSGAVDPSQMETLQDMLVQMETVRPDVVGGIQALSRGLAAALAGDFTTLTRLLDIPITKIQGLSEETQAFIDGAQDATDQQLGRVTRLAGGVETDAEGALKALREILDAAGITQKTVDDLRDELPGTMGQIREELRDTLEDIGMELLPTLNELLQELLEIIRSPEFDEFADAFADFAVDGLERLVALVKSGDLDALTDGIGDMADRLREVNWDAIGGTVQRIGDAAERIHTLLSMPVPEWLTSGRARQSGEATRGAIQEGVGAVGDFAEGVRASLFPNAGANQAGLGNLVPGGNNVPEVKVIVGVDEEGQLNVKKVARREGIQVANEVVGGLTKE